MTLFRHFITLTNESNVNIGRIFTVVVLPGYWGPLRRKVFRCDKMKQITIICESRT